MVNAEQLVSVRGPNSLRMYIVCEAYLEAVLKAVMAYLWSRLLSRAWS
jgi:hypothetical protein